MTHAFSLCAIRLLLTIALLASTAVAAEAPTPDAAPPTAPAADDSSPPSVEGEVREQSIYIPYNKLRAVFEKEGRGVFLPYEKFEALWRAARSTIRETPDVRPPVGAVITQVDSQATIEEDVVRVSATVTIEILDEGWCEARLQLGDAAIRSAQLDGQPARVVAAPGGGYRLLVEKEGTEPKEYKLQLEYAKAFTKTPGRNSVSFQAPQAPINRWRIRIPQAGVKVNIHPLLAAAEEPDSVAPGTDETVVLAFVGAAPEVRFDWTPKAEGATGLASLATVEAQQEVSIDEGVMRTRTNLKYEISRAELSQLIIEAPAQQKVTGVFDPNVRQWQVKRDGDVQQITVELFQPAIGQQSLIVELEQFLEDLPKQELAAPVVKAVDAGRQQGVMVGKLAEALRAEASRSVGLLQLDADDLPESLAKRKWDFSYRYSALPFELTLSVEKLEPRIQTTELVEAYLQAESLTVDLLVKYQVERVGVFQLQLDIPAGYEVRDVRGLALPDSQAAVVDTRHQQGTRLSVNLTRKAIGNVGLQVALQKQLNDPNLLTPTGQASEIPVELPRAAREGIEHSTSHLVVYAPESLRVNPVDPQGLRSVALQDALKDMASARDGRFPEMRDVLSFGYSREPTALALSVERRKPYVSVEQLLSARIESGLVKYEAVFSYDIRYSGVKSLRIDVPQSLSSQIRNTTTGIRDETISPQPADVPQDYVAWSLTGETEFFGAVEIRFAWEEQTEELEVGKPTPIQLPRLLPQDVDFAQGNIVIAKAESLDVKPSDDREGLRPVDPQRDIQGEHRDAAMAFEFQQDWSLGIIVQRFELEEIKHTVVDRALLNMVVIRSEQTAVQALYRMRSARQRLAIRLPKGAKFDTQPLRINGQVASLEHGDKGDYSIPLLGQSADKPFLVELRYTVAGGENRLEYPEFPNNPAVHRVQICAYLPEEMLLAGYRGPWTRDPRGSQFRIANQQPDSERAEELVAWVSEGVEQSEISSFPTDGRLSVFSTLHPPPLKDGGALRLFALQRLWVNVLMFAAAVVIALVLVTRGLATRLIATGFVVAVLVLAGVFLPTFSASVMGPVFVAALSLLVFLWVITAAASALSLATAAARARAQAAAAAAAAVSRPNQPEDEPIYIADSAEADTGGSEQSSADEPASEDNAQPDSEERDGDGGPNNA